MDYKEIKEKISSATGLELNKLKNFARTMYAMGDLNEDQWKEIEKIANERYGK